MDLGSWKALWEAQTKDARQNTVSGNVILEGVRNTYLHAERRLVAAIGVNDLVIVETPDAVPGYHQSEVQRVRSLVGELGAPKCTEALAHFDEKLLGLVPMRKPTMKSSAKRTINTSSRACRFFY